MTHLTLTGPQRTLAVCGVTGVSDGRPGCFTPDAVILAGVGICPECQRIYLQVIAKRPKPMAPAKRSSRR